MILLICIIVRFFISLLRRRWSIIGDGRWVWRLRSFMMGWRWILGGIVIRVYILCLGFVSKLELLLGLPAKLYFSLLLKLKLL